MLYVRLGSFAAFVSQAEGGKTAPRIVYLNGFNRFFSKHVHLNVSIPLRKYRKRHETKVNDNHILVTFQLTVLLYWCLCMVCVCVTTGLCRFKASLNFLNSGVRKRNNDVKNSSLMVAKQLGPKNQEKIVKFHCTQGCRISSSACRIGLLWTGLRRIVLKLRIEDV